jgi:GTP-sensing pleiotropic transcriptional regulator CodY
MPLGWFQKACALPGKAAALGAVLWYLHRRNGSKPFLLANAGLKQFGITRQAKYRGLKALESAGLISARHRGKKNPEITILDSPFTPPTAG